MELLCGGREVFDCSTCDAAAPSGGPDGAAAPPPAPAALEAATACFRYSPYPHRHGRDSFSFTAVMEDAGGGTPEVPICQEGAGGAFVDVQANVQDVAITINPNADPPRPREARATGRLELAAPRKCNCPLGALTSRMKGYP